MTTVQSALARYVPKPATSEAAVKALGARAWGEQETLVVRLSAVSDPSIRLMVKAVAAHCFGPVGADG